MYNNSLSGANSVSLATMATAGDNADTNGQPSEAGETLKAGWLTKQGKLNLAINSSSTCSQNSTLIFQSSIQLVIDNF